MTTTTSSASTAVLAQLCRCHGRYGYTRLGADFVCSACGLPAPGYEERTARNAYFRGGPLDGRAYSYESLLHDRSALTLPIMEYRWTEDVITSQRTGETARVWLWTDAQPEPGTTVTGTLVPNEQEAHDMTQGTNATTTTNVAERRKALGLSRPQVVAQTGGKVTVAQLASLELSGKRVKDGILEAVSSALTHLESQQPSANNKVTQSTATDEQESHTQATT